VVISDGMDNHSRYTNHDLMSFAVESDVQIYTIAFEDSRDNMRGVELSEVQRGLAFLDDLAERTGGLSLRVQEFESPSAAAGKISRALRNQYVIKFENPGVDISEKWHRVPVKVTLRKINVYGRSGHRSR
jgi:VWFA-related protein